MGRKRARKSAKRAEEIVRLEDLAPRAEVRGGAGKLRFGERPEGGSPPSREPQPPRPRKGR